MNDLRKAAEQAVEALENSRVFVTTREKIKHPEGTEWYDERIAALRAALAEPERKPLSLDQIEDLESRAYAATTEKGAPLFVYALRLVRSVEKAHGITEDKP